jgi:hypothetical protein
MQVVVMYSQINSVNIPWSLIGEIVTMANLYSQTNKLGFEIVIQTPPRVRDSNLKLISDFSRWSYKRVERRYIFERVGIENFDTKTLHDYIEEMFLFVPIL